MSSAKSGSDILAARERRQELLDRHRGEHAATLFLSLNIPGNDKTPPGSRALFHWALNRLNESFPCLASVAKGIDALGPYALLTLRRDALKVKQHCIALETSHPAARLIDLDVYDVHGNQISRATLSLPSRPCLVCDQPAVDCIRLGRHRPEEAIEIVQQLLKGFSFPA